MNLKEFTIILSCLACSLGMQAQTTPPAYVPTITPTAPDAAALMKFTDVQVSPYTGTSSVSVPIYNIKVKGINVPISVDYHTGGIRIEEEASSTGLGWALSAGGMITRTINDKDDLGGLYFKQPVPQIQGNLIGYQPANAPFTDPNMDNLDSIASRNCPTCSIFSNCPTCPINGNRYIFNFNCSYKVNFTGGTGDYFNPFSPLGGVPFDLEPDTYSFNFLGRSGKFIIKRDEKTVIMEKQDNLNIQVVQAGPTPASIVFTITDENGDMFYFKTTQSTTPAWQPASTPTTWYLSKILTQQKDSIIFNYGGSGYTQVASENTQSYVLVGNNVGWQYGSNTGTSYNNVVLQSIDYPDGQVQLFSTTGRADLNGGYKLDSIRVYSKTTAGLNYLKSDRFYYSYFNAGGGYELARLRLDSVKEFAGGSALKPYSFIYNAAPSAYGEKHKFAIDHWGYYNGAGNSVLIPTTSAYYSNIYTTGPVQYTFTGANREPDTTGKMKCFSLQQITYPTGGYSVFNYEANTYDYNKSASIQAEYPQQVLVGDTITLNISVSSSGFFDFSQIYPVIPTNVAGYNASINIAFISAQSAWADSTRAVPNRLYFNFNGNTIDLSSNSLDCSTNPRACSIYYQFTVNPSTTGRLPWTAHCGLPPGLFSLIRVQVYFQILKTNAQKNPTLTAGGLRIKSITDYSSAGIVAKKRTWNYHYGSSGQYSNGILMSFPSYIRQEEQPYSGGHLPALILFSSSVTNPTSAISGNIVGYSHVTETEVDPSNNDIGKTVYSYINAPDSVINYNTLRMPGIPNIGSNLNGSELSRIVYRNSGGGNYRKVRETDNTYHTANDSVFYSAKYLSSVNANPGGVCNGVTLIPNAGIGEFFPSIKSQRVLLDNTTNYVYDPADTTKFQKTVTVYYYDNKKNYLVTRSKVTTSNGDTHVSKIMYPQDYIPTGSTKTSNAILDSLIFHNMVAENIEKRDSLYRSGSSTGYVISATENRYKQLITKTMVQDKVYRLDVAYPVTDFVPMSITGNTYNQDSRYRPVISFDNYDPLNNSLNQYSLYNQLPVSIIWDYRHMLPIAQVKNGTQADVAYTSFEADGTGNWTVSSNSRDSVTTALTGTKSYNVALGISKGGLTAATTYVVSYWTKSGTALSITGTITGYPIKGATINGWTYYEHKVTGQTTISITGSGNIDEVRLYPQNAQMTSYTYRPQIGVSSVNDARAGISYYEYDNFQRLMNIKDQNGNITKHFDYHYAGM